MSTPFPLEEASQAGKIESTFDLSQNPPHGSFFGDVLRSPYTLLEGLGSGAAKGEAVLGGLLHLPMGPDENEMLSVGLSPEQIASAKKQAEVMQQHGADMVSADARRRVKAMTPDAATTGTATQVLHGVSSGLEQIITGSLLGGPVGGAAMVGAGEGLNRYQELSEQGVDPATALESGALTGVTSGAGALLPAAYGSGLLTRILTGAAGNTAFGVANRYADHAILQANGYPEMAAQQEGLDATQMLVDAALGATFGVIHHAGMEGPRRAERVDAALAANLALRDRASAPGVATDPASAGAHQAALEKAVEDLVQGKPVDVSEAGLERAKFLERPAPDEATPLNMMASALKESGFLDEEANLRDLEEQFAQRREPTEVPRGTQQAEKSAVLAPAVPEGQVRYYHGGAPKDDHTGSLWFTSSKHDAEGWASRSDDMKVWYVDIPKDHPVRGEGDIENGMPYPSRVELPADIANRRRVLTDEETPKDPVAQALAERPNMKIPDEEGKRVAASDALENAKDDTDHPAAIKAAVDCFSRRGA